MAENEFLGRFESHLGGGGVKKCGFFWRVLTVFLGFRRENFGSQKESLVLLKPSVKNVYF